MISGAALITEKIVTGMVRKEREGVPTQSIVPGFLSSSPNCPPPPSHPLIPSSLQPMKCRLQYFRDVALHGDIIILKPILGLCSGPSILGELQTSTQRLWSLTFEKVLIQKTDLGECRPNGSLGTGSEE